MHGNQQIPYMDLSLVVLVVAAEILDRDLQFLGKVFKILANQDIAVGLIANQSASFKHQFENQPEFVLDRVIVCLRTTGSSGGLSRVFSRKNSNLEFFERSAII